MIDFGYSPQQSAIGRPAPIHDKSRPERSDRGAALLALLGQLDERDYDFVTSTPASHARVVARPDRREAHSLTDVFGWSLPLPPGCLRRK